MYKIRFHLGAGEHFMQWQVKQEGNEPLFYDPIKYSILMFDCMLINIRKIAEEIHAGKNKEVCAWIAAYKYFVIPHFDIQKEHLDRLSYNPKRMPWWTNKKGLNVDDNIYETIVSQNKELYVLAP